MAQSRHVDLGRDTNATCAALSPLIPTKSTRLLILCGAFVPLASLPMIVVLLVAIFTVHLPNGFSSIKLVAYDGSGAHFGQPGYETDLLYLAALLGLCFGGAGPFSLDGYVSGRRRDAARCSLRLHGSAAADQGGAPDREAKIRLSEN